MLTARVSFESGQWVYAVDRQDGPTTEGTMPASASAGGPVAFAQAVAAANPQVARVVIQRNSQSARFEYFGPGDFRWVAPGVESL